VLSVELFDKSLALPDFPRRPDLIGIDMSGAATYADRLADKLGYTNTFLHKPPKLDITVPDDNWLGRCDFVISSDVFEHVAPPVGRAFDNVLRLLKPGGVFVLTVPYAKDGETVEHFPELHDYQLAGQPGQRVLVNTTADGRMQRFDQLVFHGGEGETLEMRVFSESGVLGELQRAGFSDIRVHREPCPEYGIPWLQDWSLPITARRPLAAGD
jgi:SAM-dependent methyltransferase